MKIKVTYEKVFDSNEFYSDYDLDDLKDLNFKSFKDGILEDLSEDYYMLDEFKFEEIKE